MVFNDSSDVIIESNDDQSRNNKLYHSRIIMKKLDIPPQNIKKVNIREWCFKFVPTMEMTILDSGTYMDKFPLEDGDEIVIELSIDKETDPLSTVFTIQSHEVVNVGDPTDGVVVIEIVAMLKSEGLFDELKNRSFSKQNSSDVVSTIASEVGFTPNIIKPSNDVMTWLQCWETNHEFLSNVMDMSYSIEDDLTMCYTDIFSETTFTTLNTMLGSDYEYILIPDIKLTYDSPVGEEGTTVYNGKDLQNIFYSDYEYYNISPIVNKSGTNTQLTYYDTTENVEVLVESKDDNIKLTSHSNKREDRLDQVSSYYDVREVIGENTHGNYFKSLIQNSRKMNEFFSSYVTVISRPNIDLKLMSKVIVHIPSGESEFPDYIHSGEYMLGGRIWELDGDAFFTTRLFLFNNGINAKKGFMEDYESGLTSK